MVRMVRIRAIIAVLAVALAVLIGACGGSATPSPASSSVASGVPSSSATPEPTPEPTPTAQAPTPFVEYQDPTDLALGDCYDPINDEDTDVLLAAAMRSCDEPHLHEVFGLVQLEDPLGAPFPSDRDIENASLDLCDPAFEKYVGESVDDSQYGYLYYTPSEATWEDGDRLVMCVIDDRGDRITGSAKGTGE
jgi:Septum formation